MPEENGHWNIITKIKKNVKRNEWKGTMKKLNNEEFIIKARKIHGDKYSYSKFIYIKYHVKGIIICELHGEFLQRPSDHLQEHGCPNCVNNIKSTVQEFFSKAKVVHGNEYDYSKFIYVNAHTKGIIVCKDHDEFLQTPNGHLNGRGCLKCKGKKLRSYFSSNLLEFIYKANGTHDFKYVYDKYIYINSLTKGIIICKKHGEFKQTPGNHLSGQGCPKCLLSKGECKIIKYLDNNNIKYIQQYKFVNCKNPKTGCQLKFDFYIPDKNLLIEYDGEQHFFMRRFGNYIQTREDLENLQFRDNIKTEYAAAHNIKLLRISYTNIKNIEGILITKL